MILPAQDLQKQATWVRKMLRPISNVLSGPASEMQTVQGVWILGTHGGLRQGNYRDWRFATPAPRFHAMYFEVWKPTPGNSFHIQQAYLNIYERDSAGNEDEILCLHCDPGESETAPHAKYKRGPHLHLSFTGDPLKRSHLALHVGRVNEIVATSSAFRTALMNSVQMIKDEVIELLTVR